MSTIPVLAIHGGAGTISRASLSPEAEQEYTNALRAIIDAGHDALGKGANALEVVTMTVCMFEDSPLFNAGRGAVYTSAATHELDAAIMNGATLEAGAVACVHGIRNPILAARAVMEHSKHVFMVGQGAMNFLRGQNIAFESEEYFHTAHRLAQLHEAQRSNAGMVLDHDGGTGPDAHVDRAGLAPLDEKTKMGTVGAVALDVHGRLAAATSTGGLTNKLPGRVGDTPVIGAGCYADDVAAVSCTGTGEYFIRLCVGKDVAARVRYLGQELTDAARATLDGVGALGGSGGFIAVDRRGGVTLPFNTEGMYRAWVGRDGVRHVAIYGTEE